MTVLTKASVLCCVAILMASCGTDSDPQPPAVVGDLSVVTSTSTTNPGDSASADQVAADDPGGEGVVNEPEDTGDIAGAPSTGSVSTSAPSAAAAGERNGNGTPSDGSGEPQSGSVDGNHAAGDPELIPTGGWPADLAIDVDVGPTDPAEPIDPIEPAAPVDPVIDVEVDPDEALLGQTVPLTGLITTDSSLSQRRAVVVKIVNNPVPQAPEAGPAAADIVYEVLVEGGHTRFAAVFHSEIPDRIGPVRSARSTDIDLVADLGVPYLASSGANPGVNAQLRRAHRAGVLNDIGGAHSSWPYARDTSLRKPDNLFFHYANVPADSEPSPPPSLFEFGSQNPPGVDGAAGVTVVFHKPSGVSISHVWDSLQGGWVRIRNDGVPMVTETNFGLREVAPANVVVLWTSYTRSAADPRSPQATSYGSGDALLLTAGAVHEAHWERTRDQPGFRFTDDDGNPLHLAQGSTWLLLGNTSPRFWLTDATTLSQSEADRLLADARARAADRS